jgi:predicted negative regulator of RcsB-dependent stress response
MEEELRNKNINRGFEKLEVWKEANSIMTSCNNVLLFFLPILIFFSFNNFAQTKIISEKNILKGLEHSYHFRWDKAGKTFQDLIEIYPDKPEGYHFLSSVYAWYYLSSKNKSDLDTFIIFSDIALDKGIEELSKNPEDDHLNYIIGSNYSYRAIVFASAENYLDAVWAGKKSDSYLNDALELNPGNYDAYLGLGLFNFAAGQTPTALRWALKLAGISGDIETGLSQIKLTADNGKYSKVEAQYYYSQISTEFEPPTEYLSPLVKKYPENILFSYSLAALKIKERNLNQAENILKKIIDIENDRFIQIISFSNFLLGDVFYKKNNFDSAIVYYKRFLEITPDNDYTGIASLRLGISYEITGERDSAKVYYELTGNGNMDLDDDIYAKRKGAAYSKRTLSDNEIAVIKSSNLIDSGNYQAAYDSLTNILEEIVSEKLKSETYLYLSEAAYNLKRYDESISLASAAIKTDVMDEKWILPYANYFAARANHIAGDEQAVSYFIDQVEEYSDYDYQSKMKNLLYSLKQKKLL